ncbi:exodeoxyribonuclease VII small subunit [Rhodocyclus tenuis]|uniref:Exodeoxyribonuclease 7 small subunit n=2 Tax=Rhodocyclus TaxID=1064 RepID=A0A6L5JWD3_RHOTE|nr:exodeoxyribonuclease VII small subunit [Rhodocyclus gracilis]MQY51665.1 exodeoxyribonuclease VII small subunit [Rhodocyclus gracilis]MRD73146.1 exodeoxyribonuclease VII small subunit [Rhodocyclus gracilis]NJA89074.1 exodeoxyribonuclease VII small subunit [Rhodocyclus gracilis]
MSQSTTETGGDGTSDRPAEDGPSFESALAELEAIVEKMESGDLPLEESLNAYRRGAELLQRCQRQIADAEQRVRILDNGALRDFGAAAGESR